MRTVVGITEPESASTAQFARTSDIESNGATSDAGFVVIYSMAYSRMPSSRRGSLLTRAPLRTGRASWPRIRLKHG